MNTAEAPCGCVDRIERSGYILVCDVHTEAMDLSIEERIAMITKWISILDDFRIEKDQIIAKPKRELTGEGSPRTASEFMRFVQARIEV